jgi:hypothetical protein
MLEECLVTCPYCWEPIPLLVDRSGGSAEYIEDCSVCCRPLVVTLKVIGDGRRCRVSVRGEDD